MTGADLDAGRLPAKLSQEVGAKLRERRTQLSLTLRRVAETANISAAHLSDVEKGRTHPSLPVLLRIGKALDLPLAQLLPRLGGHHVRPGSTTFSDRLETPLSDPDLQLRATAVHLGPERVWELEADPEEDVLIFVVSGECAVEIDGTSYRAGERDSLDVEHARRITMRAAAPASALVCRGPRPPLGR